MKRSFLWVGLVLLCAAPLRADLVMVQKVEGAVQGQAAEMTVKVKGNKIRTDVSREVSTLTDTATGDTITLMHAQKAYQRISAQEARHLMERLQGQVAQESKDTEPAKVEATGKHETVNGWAAEIYLSQTGETKITYWIAKEVPGGDKLRDLFNQLQSSPLAKLAQGSMVRQPTDLPGVAVKTRIEPPYGQKLTVTLISVKEQPVDDAEFDIPADYKELPSPAFAPASFHP